MSSDLTDGLHGWRSVGGCDEWFCHCGHGLTLFSSRLGLDEHLKTVHRAERDLSMTQVFATNYGGTSELQRWLEEHPELGQEQPEDVAEKVWAHAEEQAMKVVDAIVTTKLEPLLAAARAVIVAADAMPATEADTGWYEADAVRWEAVKALEAKVTEIGGEVEQG